MRQKKRVLKYFAFYDRPGMERWLEQMARKGWMLRGKRAFSWIFTRIEPKNLRFGLVYSNEINDDTLYSIHAQMELDEICRECGWNRAAGRYQMQFYWTDDPSANPLLTDPVAEVEALTRIRRTVLRRSIFGFLPAALCNLNVILRTVLAVRQNPLFLLQSPFLLILPMFWALLLAVLLIRGLQAACWRGRVLKSSEEGPDPRPGAAGEALIRLLAVLFTGVALFLTVDAVVPSAPSARVEDSFRLLILAFAGLLAFGVYRFLRRNIISPRVSAVTVGILFALVSIIGTALVTGQRDRFAKLDHTEQTVTVGKQEQTILADPIPVTVSDLLGVSQIRETIGYHSGSFLTDISTFVDRGINNQNGEHIHMNYTVYDIPFSQPYDFVLDRQLHPDYYAGFRRDYTDEYACDDPTAWCADAAYVHCSTYGSDNETRFYAVLCYEKRIVTLYCSWEMTPEQREIFGRAMLARGD